MRVQRCRDGGIVGRPTTRTRIHLRANQAVSAQARGCVTSPRQRLTSPASQAAPTRDALPRRRKDLDDPLCRDRRFCASSRGHTSSLMSALTVFGILLVAVSAVSIAIVAALFVWGAREDGRHQRRTKARLSRGSKRG